MNLGSEFLGPWRLNNCPHRYYPNLKGSTETQKTFEKDTNQLKFLLVVLVLSIVNVLGAEIRFRLQSAAWRGWVSFANEMFSLEKPALHFFRSLHVKNLSLKKKKGFYLELFAHPNAVSFTIWQCFDFCAFRKSLN